MAATATVTVSFHFPSPTIPSRSPFHHNHSHQLWLSPFSAAAAASTPNASTSATVASRQNICMPLCAFGNPSSPALLAKASSLNTQPMVPPYNVLITGSTKGIGYALAKEFLKAGDKVIICSRSYERVETAVQGLRVEFGEQHVWGTKCDVRNGEDVKNLVSFAKDKLKYIDIWVLMPDSFPVVPVYFAYMVGKILFGFNFN